MIDQYGIMIGSGFVILIIGFLGAIGFLIYTLMEIKKAITEFRDFLKFMENRLTPVLMETEETLKSIKKVSTDVGDTTENLRSFSSAVYDLGNDVRGIVALISEFREGISLKAVGLKAGIKAALNVLAKQLKEGR